MYEKGTNGRVERVGLAALAIVLGGGRSIHLDREPRPRLLVLVLESVSTMQSTRGQLQPSNIRALSHASKDNITCCSLVFGMSTDV